MSSTRMDELFALAEEQHGLFTSKEARALGIKDSVLVRLRQHGRLEGMSRGDYRTAHYPAEWLAQYCQAVLWTEGNNDLERIALSHETAMMLYRITDANPPPVNLTVPVSAWMRRVHPNWIEIRRANFAADDVQLHERMPLITVERPILDVLATTPKRLRTRGNHRFPPQDAA